MNRSYTKIRHIQESNILLERRVINEQILPSLWTDTTTALQGIADYYNSRLDSSVYQQNPKTPKIYFSVKRTHTKDGSGNETDIAWQAYFGNKLLSLDKLPSWYIIDQNNIVTKPDIAKWVNQCIATPIGRQYINIKNTPAVDLTRQVNTAVAAINAAIKKEKNPTKP